jgi:hypothetical protein
MNVVPRVSRQPVADFSDLVGAIVVHHQMYVQSGRKILVDFVEKSQEFLVPMPAITGADGDSRSYIHSRQQRRNTMPLVIVGLASGHARRQRQNRFRPIQCLDLAFLIQADYNRTIRRVQIQAHNVPYLFHKLWVFGELEVLYTMRYNPNARQIRTIAFCDRPVSAAMSRVLPCVPLAGIDSSVLVTTSSIC